MNAASLAERVGSLLCLPDAVVQLNKLIDDPHARNVDLTEIISQDPGLSVRVLRLVNSPHFAFVNRVGSLSHAITVLGRQELRKLAMAAGMAEAFQGIPRESVDMDTFWCNSVTCATLAELLAGRCRQSREIAYLSGLLHGIGRLVFYTLAPDDYRRVLALSPDQTEQSLIAAEREVFGFDHAELGAELCRLWHLPLQLQQTLRYHLNPLEASDDDMPGVAILHVAADMASGIAPSTQVERYAKDYVPGFVPEVWRELDQPEERIPEFLQIALMRGFETLQIVSPSAMMVY
ncbi:HDOD domain-containing protein [Methylococcus sp. EFPC2]|uniref:HDOD domain-containing protein n=1 Tax=Methylococcus sp. EFPC2 TaxID=2812648 RepID=UPI0019670EFA|nr:HDOD domain-containing protein [Methylococcus sp. EFPC2]QSA97168.1 HDOD domain-containing protein [Methylococcus sp. EFPC2]